MKASLGYMRPYFKGAINTASEVAKVAQQVKVLATRLDNLSSQDPYDRRRELTPTAVL